MSLEEKKTRKNILRKDPLYLEVALEIDGMSLKPKEVIGSKNIGFDFLRRSQRPETNTFYNNYFENVLEKQVNHVSRFWP